MRTCEHWQRIVIRTFVSRQYTSTRKTPILNPICELGERGSTVLKTRASHMDTSGIFHRVMQDVLARSKVVRRLLLLPTPVP